MKILAEHKYKNDKAIRVLYLNSTDQRKLGVPKCDTLALCFEMDDHETRYYIRPDEAVLIIRLLSEGVFKSVRGYEVGLLREAAKK